VAASLSNGHTPAWIEDLLDPEVLTIGFARRVPTYKRLTLMLRDPDRLKALLLDPKRPVQIVLAGKSHPADEGGKQLIQQMVQFTDDPAVRHRIAFLPDYDIGMARYLYWGVDVWLNNPLRPLEACGTSGMKAALNGALNLSIMDGWWDEWFDGENGWAIPSADGMLDADRRDDVEAEGLYDLIENQVAPRFYDRDSTGVPKHWVQMVRHTLKTLGPKVLATRMVQDYVEQLYAPAALAGRAMAADGFAAARSTSQWRAKVTSAWPGVKVLYVDTQLAGHAELGNALQLRAEVALNGLTVDEVSVQAAFGPVDTDDRITATATVALIPGDSTEGSTWFEGAVPLDQTGAFGYTVRVLPKDDSLASPAELGLVSLA
jgi:starch phosphorylase